MTNNEKRNIEKFRIDCVEQAGRLLNGKERMNMQRAVEISIMAFSEETDQLKREAALALTALAMAVIVNQQDEEKANNCLINLVEQVIAEKEMFIMKQEGKIQ